MTTFAILRSNSDTLLIRRTRADSYEVVDRSRGAEASPETDGVPIQAEDVDVIAWSYAPSSSFALAYRPGVDGTCTPTISLATTAGAACSGAEPARPMFFTGHYVYTSSAWKTPPDRLTECTVGFVLSVTGCAYSYFPAPAQ
jgi:hypothetical protein